ncbi:hypothetical protein ACS0TY_035719 [Phlomoides rotata]
MCLLEVDVGEAMALYEALQWLKNLGLERVKVEVDSKTVAEALTSSTSDLSIFGDYILRCKLFLESRPNISVSFVRRNANVLAHRLARASRSYSSPNTWVEPPNFVDGLLRVSCVC